MWIDAMRYTANAVIVESAGRSIHQKVSEDGLILTGLLRIQPCTALSIPNGERLTIIAEPRRVTSCAAKTAGIFCCIEKDSSAVHSWGGVPGYSQSDPGNRSRWAHFGECPLQLSEVRARRD